MKSTTNFLIAALVAAGTLSLTACGGGGSGGANIATIPTPGPSRSVRPMNADQEIVPIAVEVQEESGRDPVTGRVAGGSCPDVRLECFPRIQTTTGDTDWFDSDNSFVFGASGHWSADIDGGQATYDGSLRVNVGQYNTAPG